MQISGTTRLAGLIGFPATYSLSPALHNAAYTALGIDMIYTVFPVRNEDLVRAVDGMRALGLVGLSVTLPHKEGVAALCDWRAPEVELLGAANTLAWRNDRLEAHATDGIGFVNSLVREHTYDVAGKRCVIAGAGGSARSVALALNDAGAADVAVVNRTAKRAAQVIASIGGVARVGTPIDFAAADLVVNATPIGMDDHPGVPFDVNQLSSHAFVIDLIYAPEKTELLQAAAARGCRTANGLGMLVHQAAAQIELWTGRSPDTDIMRSALRLQ